MAQPEIVNSYQGAFGPPTKGHYEAMLYAARKTLADFPDKQILMLYMPTAESSSKPHLALTKDERIVALSEFCAKLKAEFPEAKINFEASTIEYTIYNEKKSTATIHTLRALKATYPIATILLTMGLDNLYDLPFWGEVENYAYYIKRIYVPTRDITPEDEKKTLTMNIGGSDLTFNKYASWDARYKGDISAVTYESSELKVKLENLWTPPNTEANKMVQTKSLKQLFESMKFVLLEKPSPTSSSLLRVALKKYYTDGEEKYLSAVKTLEGREPVPNSVSEAEKAADPWYTINQKAQHLEKPAKVESFDKDFKVAFPNTSGGGRRKTRRNRKNK